MLVPVLASFPLFAKAKPQEAAQQVTLSLIKPDAVGANSIGEIIARFEDAGLEVRAAKMVRLSRDEAAAFYEVHKDRPFFNTLVETISSGRLMALALSGPNAIEKNREIMGATDPEIARPGTIRRDFGTDITRNAVHGSDSPETAKVELQFFFEDDAL